eukprot:m.301414 g.301414  ORF g.301414 m.301414 type:complete len:51 (-) comp15879_c0_seq25:665-817(-)
MALRKSLVHQAQPVPNLRVLEVQESDKSLTEPQSPQWASKRVKRETPLRM